MRAVLSEIGNSNSFKPSQSTLAARGRCFCNARRTPSTRSSRPRRSTSGLALPGLEHVEE
eukprot:7116395-Pyramimonas_sp.AAC.1